VVAFWAPGSQSHTSFFSKTAQVEEAMATSNDASVGRVELFEGLGEELQPIRNLADVAPQQPPVRATKSLVYRMKQQHLNSG
jgi:hypothetical protein